MVPRRQNTLTDKDALRRRLRANRMSNDAATSGMNLPQHGTVEPQTPPIYAVSLVKFVKWVEHREKDVETDTEIDSAMSTWMKSEFEKGSLASSGERLVSAWVNKNPSLGRHDAGAEYLGKLQTLEEALAANSMIGNRVPAAMLHGASASWGPAEVSRIKRNVVVFHLSDFLLFLSEGDDGVNAATGSTIPR